MADAPAAAERRTASLEEHPASLGVREQDVVVLGQEADGRGRVRIGPRRVGQVEELAAVLAAEGPQARPEALDDLAQPGQPAPGRRRPRPSPARTRRGTGGRRRRATAGASSGRPSHDSAVASLTCAASHPRRRGAAPGRARACSGRRARAPPGRGPGTARRAPLGARCPRAAAPRAARPRTRGRARGRRPRGRAPRRGAVAARRPAPAASSGRSRRQSSAVTRWIVPRMTTIRTTSRATRRSASASRPEAVDP